MKMILMTLLIISTSVFATLTKEDVFLLDKGSNKIIAKIMKRDDKTITLKSLDNTTSEVLLKLSYDKKLFENMPDGYKAQFCVNIEEKCNWQCRGELISRSGGFKPWKEYQKDDLLKKVESCN